MYKEKYIRLTKKYLIGGASRKSLFFISSLHLLKQYPRRWVFLQYNILYRIFVRFSSCPFLIHA